MNGMVNGSSEEENRKESSGMYKVKRPYDLPTQVQLPNGVMYEMSPVSESAPALGSESGSSKSMEKTATGSNGSTTEMDTFEQKQLHLIEELQKLHQTISNIHSKVFGLGSESAAAASSSSTLKTDASMSSTVSKEKPQLYKSENVDVVIHSNPDRPPYSLLFFVNLLEKHYSNAVVCMRSHVHCSFVGTLNLDALSVFNYEKQGANFRFTLVWKNVESSNMIITPVQCTQIMGEENIARFLSRLLPTVEPSMNYDSLNGGNLAKVDGLLEVVNSDDVVSIVEKELKNNGQQKFLIGQPSVADLVLYSAVAAKLFKGQKKIPDVVKSWFQQMEVCFGFHSGS